MVRQSFLVNDEAAAESGPASAATRHIYD